MKYNIELGLHKYDLRGQHDLDYMTIHHHYILEHRRLGTIILLKLKQHLLLLGLTTHILCCIIPSLTFLQLHMDPHRR